jgi:PAS domain S-box-containing protein
MAMIESSSEGIIVVDRSGIISFASPSVQNLLGYAPHSIVGKSFLDSVVSENRESVEKLFTSAGNSKEGKFTTELKILNSSGQCREISAHFGNYLHAKAIRGFVINIRDITEHVIIEETLKKNDRKYRSLYDNAMVGLLTTDLETGLIIAANDLGFHAFGYDSKYDFVGSSILDHYSDIQCRDALIEELKIKGEVHKKEILFRRKDDSVFWGEISSKISTDKGTIESVLIDVTKSKEAEEHVYQLTFYDPLTGLPNRDMFQNRIQTELLKSQRIALLCIGIDKFKNINDMYGAWIGDSLLKIMAKKLKQVYFNKDMVARFAGDQFMVLLSELGHRDDTLKLDNIDKIA